MSDQNNDQTQNEQVNQNQEEQAPSPSEIDVLKQRAKLMGIVHSNNIGVETLRAKIEAKMQGLPDPEPEPEVEQVNGFVEDPAEQLLAEANPFDPGAPAVVRRARPVQETVQQLRDRLIKESMRLIRVRITNLNPQKKDLPGEIFTVGNEFIGTVRKYIPYGEVTDNGYHIPFIIFQELESRRFVNIRTRKGRGNTPIVEQNWAKEFALEVLDPLTPHELARLAASQAAGNNID